MANFIKAIKNYGNLNKAQKRQDIQEVFRLIKDSDNDGVFIIDCQKVLSSFGLPATDQFLATLKSVYPSYRWAATEALMAISPQIVENSLCKRVVNDLLIAMGDDVWSVRAGAAAALGSFYLKIEEPGLKKSVVQAIQKATGDQQKYVRGNAEKTLNQLGIAKEEAIATPTHIYTPKPKLSFKMENGRIPTFTQETISLILVESNALGTAGPGGSSFQNAIQSWNLHNFNEAASQFKEALRQGLDPLCQGYAYANLGIIMVKKDKLLEATEHFLKVFTFERAIYESVHDSAQYLSVILDEVGRQEEAGMLKKLVSQTQAKLGYSLSTSAIEQVRRLVHETEIK